MDKFDVLRLTGYLAPMMSALLCFSLLSAYRIHHGKDGRTGNRLLRIMTAYYAAIAVNWASTVMYGFYPVQYVQVNMFCYLCLLLVPLFFYHLVYLLTGTGEGKPFPMQHYIFPPAVFAVFTVWSFFVPFDVQTEIVTSRGSIQPGYEAYSLFFSSRVEIRGVYNVLYVLLGLRRLILYRRVVGDYSADQGRTSMRWLYLLFILSLANTPLATFTLFIAKREMIVSLLPLLFISLHVVQHAVLCYCMMTGDYVIIRPKRMDKVKEKQSNLNRTSFEIWINKHKPYLNPELKITDLIYPLATNRTYLSKFINNEYGMNFSHYINTLRLKELDRLRKDPACANANKMELLLRAGFSSYSGYKKFVNLTDSV
jgi:AraC-like DNA-binding protein